ncbi:MAG: translation initiation factor IF-2 [Candidatus Gracilibacteria bacterium]|nr:translation initiation factor IF-2 [Candidatus Gracilibacteria bacterium]
MPKKTDKSDKKVDDYYANIESDDAKKSSDKKAKVKPKIKLRAKKKVPAEDKKQADKKNTDKKSNNKNKKKKITSGIRELSPEEKKKVSNKSTKTTKNKRDFKPTDKKEGRKSNFKGVKKSDNKTQEPRVKKTFSIKTKDELIAEKKARQAKKSEKSNDNKSGTKTFEKPQKKFGPNKQAEKTSSNFKKGKKKGKFSKWEKEQEKEQEFIRSTQNLMKKKEEKNLEDIKQNLTDRTGETVIIGDVIPVKELSDKTGIPVAKLMAEFMKNGMMLNLNSPVDFETASIVIEPFNIKLERDTSGGLSIEEVMEGDISVLLQEDDTSKLKNRPPVISIMGHVDHGKTSLLDQIRKSKVAEGEAGGITQSIGAYQVEVKGQKITFLDTPGHEAFTVMRARGAKSTDIAILVVAADEGVKPQTIESINHAKEAGIPVVVAINKMDKQGANPDHVKGQLAEHGLVGEDWGGDVIMVPVSAKMGDGIDELLENILLVAEMAELKANPERNGVGTVIESHLDTKFGSVATVLINTGNLNKGDHIVCGGAHGKVKVLRNHLHKNIDTALPGDPALIVGLDKVVEGGDILQVVKDNETARKKAIEFEEIMKAKKAQSQSGLELLMSRIKSGMLKDLKVVVKADTNGSLEALKAALLKISNDEVRVAIAHAGVGNINESDVLMASASQTILVGFNVDLVGKASEMVDSSGIELINHRVIYHITERIEAIATGMLDPKEVEIVLGEAKVKQIFYTGKKYLILGLGLLEGNKIESGAKVRVIRKDKMIGKGDIENLKSGVEDVKELEGPIECGVQFNGDTKIEEKDILEIYKIEIQK